MNSSALKEGSAHFLSWDFTTFRREHWIPIFENCVNKSRREMLEKHVMWLSETHESSITHHDN